MVERVEITDRGSAEKWLETQEHQTQVWFATRCALRGLPGLGIGKDLPISVLAFASLQATLISAAAATYPAAEMNHLEGAARSVRFPARAANAPISASRAADSAARAADSTAFPAHAANAAADSVNDSARSASADSATASSHSAAFAAASLDAEHPMQWCELWRNDALPEELQLGWTALKQLWDNDDADWSFWIEWYEGILNGTPLPWELTHRIALEVTPEQWDAGQAVVAERIKTIRLQFDLEQELAKLKEQLAQQHPDPAHDRKHNNPPPLDDDSYVSSTVLAELWAEIESIEDTLAETVPDPTILERAAKSLWGIARKIALYCGRKIDTALEEAAKTIGSTGTKWAFGAGATYWIGMQEGTQSVAKMAFELAQRLSTGG